MKTTAIDFDNLDEAKQPSKENKGFSKMDTVKSEAGKATKAADNKVASSEVDATKDPHLKEENKLPPATELEQEEENPDQRKIAGEAPYITAARPDAFTKEVEGGVVAEEKKSKKEVSTTQKDNSVPML